MFDHFTVLREGGIVNQDKYWYKRGVDIYRKNR